MKRISTDNGHSFTSPEEAINITPWNIIVSFMDDDTREKVADELAPCSNLHFLTRYLDLAPADLIIG